MHNPNEEREQHVKISNYIKAWQLENIYTKESPLKEHNEKFKKDFNAFLNENDFDQEIKNLYLN